MDGEVRFQRKILNNIIKLKNILNETWPIKFLDKMPLRPENPSKNAGRIEFPKSNDSAEGQIKLIV